MNYKSVKSLLSGKFKYMNSDISGKFRIIYKKQLRAIGKDSCRVLHNMESSEGYPSLPVKGPHTSVKFEGIIITCIFYRGTGMLAQNVLESSYLDSQDKSARISLQCATINLSG